MIALGYAAGPWFARGADAAWRQRQLLVWGVALLAGFAVLRALNIYGDKPWVANDTPLATLMGFVNITKYPPSLLFIMLTLGIGLLVLRCFERKPNARWLAPLAVYGAAPMFFYVLHLYVLKLLYLGAESIWGPNQGQLFGFDSMGWVWLATGVLAFALYPAVGAFANLKARRRDIAWLKYL